MTDADIEAFRDAVGEAGRRASEFLAEDTDLEPEDIEATVADLPTPDPFEDRPLEDRTREE